jgi:hypothetical protein
MKTPGTVPITMTQVSGQAILPSFMKRRTPPGIATMLKRKFVALTDGVVKCRTLIWKGRSRNAPDNPPIDAKNDMTKATRGGMNTYVSTPEIGNTIDKKSMLDYKIIKN